MTRQISNHIMMVRPASFGYNAETAANNAFQTEPRSGRKDFVKAKAIEEFDRAVESLRQHGVRVTVIEDTPDPIKPDAIFPNNWVSFHEDGIVITYPMYALNRRSERREEILEQMAKIRPESRRYAFEYYEEEGLILEGTGSLLLDRDHKIAYACLSERTDIRLLDKWCVLTKYTQHAFHAEDTAGLPIYHTNVIMALGVDFAMLCLECMPREAERAALLDRLEATGREVIPINMEQVSAYAGNMLQVLDGKGQPLLVMSQQAHDSLTPHQLEILAARTAILPIDIHVIETVGGGSIRCMMAEVF